MGVVCTIFWFSRMFITDRFTLAAENLALRHRLGVVQRSVKRPRLRRRDRILWVSGGRGFGLTGVPDS